MQKTLYTIGYSGYNANDFLDVLNKNGINAVIDIRSNPFSSHYPVYNKEILENTLKRSNIYYRSYANEFGAQQSERCFYTQQGYLDFEVFTASEKYNHAYQRIEDGLMKEYVFALMCSEKDPIDCHRSIMISKTFSDNGYSILHLIPNNKPMTQFDVEERLLNKYFPNRDQLSFFTENLSFRDLITESYRKRNADIGYYMGEN